MASNDWPLYALASPSAKRGNHTYILHLEQFLAESGTLGDSCRAGLLLLSKWSARAFIQRKQSTLSAHQHAALFVRKWKATSCASCRSTETFIYVWAPQGGCLLSLVVELSHLPSIRLSTHSAAVPPQTLALLLCCKLPMQVVPADSRVPGFCCFSVPPRPLSEVCGLLSSSFANMSLTGSSHRTVVARASLRGWNLKDDELQVQVFISGFIESVPMIMRVPDPLLACLPCSSLAEQGICLELKGPNTPLLPSPLIWPLKEC